MQRTVPEEPAPRLDPGAVPLLSTRQPACGSGAPRDPHRPDRRRDAASQRRSESATHSPTQNEAAPIPHTESTHNGLLPRTSTSITAERAAPAQKATAV